MKKIILLFTALVFVTNSFSRNQDTPPEEVILKGDMRITDTKVIKVSVTNNTLTTAFDKDIDNVVITVSKENGEIVSEYYLDAKEFDSVPITIPNYKKGKYKIEISTPEGELEGSF